MEGESTEFTFPSAVRGFHVYHRTWPPHVVQHLCRDREHDNLEDRFAVSIIKHIGPKCDENSEARATCTVASSTRTEPGFVVLFSSWRKD